MGDIDIHIHIITYEQDQELRCENHHSGWQNHGQFMDISTLQSQKETPGLLKL